MGTIAFTASRTTPRMDDTRGYLDLRKLHWQGQAGEDVTGIDNLKVSGFGAGIELTGDAWIYADLGNRSMFETTIIEFEIYCANRPAPGTYNNRPDRPEINHFSEPDIIAIGLTSSENLTRVGVADGRAWIYQVYGTLEWNQALSTGLYGAGSRGELRDNSYRVQGEDFGARWVKYEVCLGTINRDTATNRPRFLYLIAQHKLREAAEVKFRNIRIYNDPSLVIAHNFVSFTNQDSSQGIAQSLYNGYGVKLSRNAWKAWEIFPELGEVTPDTYMDCWMRAEILGEIHGVALIPADEENLVVTGDTMGGSSSDVLPYLVRISGDQPNAAPNVPYPYQYKQWVKLRLYFSETQSIGRVCSYLLLVCDEDEQTEGNYNLSTIELMLIRFGTTNPEVFPHIGSEKVFLSHKCLSVNNLSRLIKWCSPGVDRYVFNPRGGRLGYPKVTFFSEENLTINTKRIPSLTGNGSVMESARDGTFLDYLNQFYYCHWLVVTLPVISSGQTQTIFQITGLDTDSGTGDFLDYVRVSLVGGANGLPTLLYDHGSQLTDTFTISNELPYDSGLVLLTCYKEEGALVEDGSFTRRIIYRFMLNDSYLGNVQDFTPEEPGKEFGSNSFFLSAFGDADRGKLFRGDIYAIATSLRRNDLCNVRAINKELMAFYDIQP